MLGLGRVTGSFSHFSGEIVTAGGAIASASAVISADGIATGNDRRDADLRSGAFLDIEAHRDIRYATNAIEPQGEGRYRVSGTLTVRGNSAEVPLNAKVDEGGAGELRVRALGTFNRRAVGVTPGAKAMIVGRLIGVELDLIATSAT